jgi:hypothetical protein
MTTAPNNKTANPIVAIDGVVVSQTTVHFALTGSGWGYYGVEPIAAGQTIRITSSAATVTAINCFFIPPKYYAQKLPVIVNSGISYSYEELLTGETWLNGKPIYRKTFSLMTPGAAGEYLSFNTGIDAHFFVRHEAVLDGGSGTYQSGPAGYSITGELLWYAQVALNGEGKLVIGICTTPKATADQLNRGVYVTLWYTKV